MCVKDRRKNLNFRGTVPQHAMPTLVPQCVDNFRRKLTSPTGSDDLAPAKRTPYRALRRYRRSKRRWSVYRGRSVPSITPAWRRNNVKDSQCRSRYMIAWPSPEFGSVLRSSSCASSQTCSWSFWVWFAAPGQFANSDPVWETIHIHIRPSRHFQRRNLLALQEYC